MINSQDVKNGVCIRMDGRLYFVIDFLHVKPGSQLQNTNGRPCGYIRRSLRLES